MTRPTNTKEECRQCQRLQSIIETKQVWAQRKTDQRDLIANALRTVAAALGDRLLANGPLSKEYVFAVNKEIEEALKL